MGDDIKVGNQCGLQDDGNIGGVKQLDGVCVILSTVACRLDWQVNSEALLLGEQKRNIKTSF